MKINKKSNYKINYRLSQFLLLIVSLFYFVSCGQQEYKKIPLDSLEPKLKQTGDLVKDILTSIAIIGTIIILVVIFYVQNKWDKERLCKLNESRPNLTRAEYIDLLVKEGFDKQHVEVVHDQIRKFIQMDEFSIYPEDDIHEIYGIKDLDDIELVDGICKKLNLRKMEQKDCDELNKKMTLFNAKYILTLTKILDE